MVFIKKNAALFFLASVVSTTTATVCDTFKACYLVNIQTRKETELKSVNKLQLDPLNHDGYSIRCDVNGVDELHFIKFLYDGKVQDEFGLPRYMNGDSDTGAYINKADYISTCGMKTVKIEGWVWDAKCFDFEYSIDVTNGDGSSCDGPKPTAAPVKPLTAAPVKPDTRAPVAPVSAPVSKPVMAPVPAPVSMPVAPPVNPDPVPTPVAAPVSAPVSKPVMAPVPAPISKPVVAPVPMPVFTPVSKPVSMPVTKPVPSCTYPKVWINGCCKDPSTACAYPQKWIDGACKDPSTTCLSPKVWINGICKDPSTACAYPKVWINGCCKDQSTACAYPKQWIDGSCKDTCTNNFVCPKNSCRIAHRLCYDNFDDCQCNYGYYKSGGNCVRHSWCYW